MATEHEVVFEDLHGVPDGQAVEVDLEADQKGIRVVPADAGADDDSDDIDDDGSQQAADEDDEEGDKGGGDKFSRKFQKRLSREQRAKQAAQNEAKELRARLESMEKRINGIEKSHSQADISKMESDLQAVEQQLEEAVERGETKDQIRLTKKLAELQADFKIAKKLSELDDDSDSGKPSGKPESGSDDGNPYAKDWMDRHADWYGRKGFERQTRLVNRLDKEIFNDGYDPSEEDYFEELDRRLKEKAPELFEDEDPAPPKKRNRGHPPVAPTGSGDDRPTSGKRTGLGSKVRLDERDFEVMRNFGLDTNDPEALKEFARSKRETQMQEDRK